LAAFREGARNGTIDASKSGKRQMQAKILETMMSIDRPRALKAMCAWATFMEQGAGRQHHLQFRTLEEYLPYRCKDVGHMYVSLPSKFSADFTYSSRFWHALVTFGCALTIPEHELSQCEKLVLPAVVAASLTNDLFSYDKEYEAAKAAGLSNVVNALWVLMQEHNISLEVAKERCRSRIRTEVGKYSKILAEVASREDLSCDTKKYLELMQYSVSGNVVWSLQCPRYHIDMEYNDRQLLRAEHGVDKYPTTYQPMKQKKRTRSESATRHEDKLMASSGKKARTMMEPNLSDEGLGRSVSPSDTPSSISGTTHGKGDWAIQHLARCDELPKLTTEVSCYYCMTR
jgi:hypothetical protein